MKSYILLLICVFQLTQVKSFSKSEKIASEPLAFICNELLGRPTANSITIHACANKALDVYYEYGTDSLNYSNQTEVKNTMDSVPFVYEIQGLAPNTKYFYRLKYRLAGSGDYIARASHSFRTQRASGNSFSFAIEADPHLDTNSTPASLALTFNNIFGKEPDFMLDLGDTFMSEKLPNKSQSEITKRHLLLRSYFDLVCHSVPLYLVLGNHEGEAGWELNGTANSLAVITSNTRKLYYPNPEPNSFYSGNSKSENFVGLRQNYYAWEWGNSLIVVLDPYWYTPAKLEGWGWTLGIDQYNWFKNTLTNSKAKFKFVFCHNLLGGSGKDARGGAEFAHLYEWGGMDTNMTYSFDKNRAGWGKPIHQLMVENGVTIFFHGHDHLYDKQEKDGIIYQEVPQPSNRNITNTQAANYGYTTGKILAGRGFLLVSINDTSAKVDYIKTLLPNEEKGQNKNGDIADTYTIIKSGLNNVDDIIDNSDFDLSVSPNPALDKIIITAKLPFNQNAVIEIIDLKGNLINTFNNIQSADGNISINYNCKGINGNDLVDGVYICRLTSNNVTKSFKFAISH